MDAGLLDTSQQVDYLIISHGDLIASVQPLAAMHAANGLSVKVVNVRDIYDTFSDGSVSAQAIRDYLAYIYAHYPWPAPTYVLLVGDGTVDFRGYQFGLYGHANLIPPSMGGYDAWAGASLSDNAFTLLQGNDLLGEMIISRLPVNNPTEAQTVVAKTLNYPTTFPQSRAHSTLWIADNPDNDNPTYGTQFHQASDSTIARLAPEFLAEAERVYYCKPGTNVCPPDPWYITDVARTTTAIVNGFNHGHLLAYYTGHGSNTVWAHEMLFYAGWNDRLTNATALPFLLISSCTNGYFADSYRNAMDEVLLRVSGRGTIGGYTGVTFDTLQPQTELLKEFVSAVMHEGITQTGVAATVARARIYGVLPYPENERTSVGHALSGDPALQLAQPDTCATGDLNCDEVIDIWTWRKWPAFGTPSPGRSATTPAPTWCAMAASTSTTLLPWSFYGNRARSAYASGRGQVASCRWEVTSRKLQVISGRSQVRCDLPFITCDLPSCRAPSRVLSCL